MAAPKGISWRETNASMFRRKSPGRPRKYRDGDEYLLHLEPGKLADFLEDASLLPKKPPGWKPSE